MPRANAPPFFEPQVAKMPQPIVNPRHRTSYESSEDPMNQPALHPARSVNTTAPLRGEGMRRDGTHRPFADQRRTIVMTTATAALRAAIHDALVADAPLTA